MLKFFCLLLVASFFFVSFNHKSVQQSKQDDKDLEALFDQYYKERMQLIPLEATQNSDTTQNDKLYADFTDSYRAKLTAFFTRYQTKIQTFKSA